MNKVRSLKAAWADREDERILKEFEKDFAKCYMSLVKTDPKNKK